MTQMQWQIKDFRDRRGWGGGGGTNPRSGGKHLLFGNIFAENCMKIIEIGPRGARDPTAPLDLPMQICMKIIEIGPRG